MIEKRTFDNVEDMLKYIDSQFGSDFDVDNLKLIVINDIKKASKLIDKKKWTADDILIGDKICYNFYQFDRDMFETINAGLLKDYVGTIKVLIEKIVLQKKHLYNLNTRIVDSIISENNKINERVKQLNAMSKEELIKLIMNN